MPAILDVLEADLLVSAYFSCYDMCGNENDVVSISPLELMPLSLYTHLITGSIPASSFCVQFGLSFVTPSHAYPLLTLLLLPDCLMMR